LKYDQEGSDRGNVLKTTKPLKAYDDDARAVLKYLASRPDCTGRLGVMGICIGRAPGVPGCDESGGLRGGLLLCNGYS